MDFKYFIYEIPGVKIGCSNNPERRVKEQGYEEYRILYRTNNIKDASEMEKKLQVKYNYPVDFSSYLIVENMRIASHTPESRQKAGKSLSKVKKGVKLSDYHKEAITTTMQKRGCSEDHKDKLRKVNSCPVEQYTLDGKFVREYSSIKEANLSVGITHINMAVRGRVKSAGGYIWKYRK